ncbi:hypothetical protein TNCV_3087871 [Trichonephila clavipes]|uniref:Uncharacterized protein n=1 Tax=Trichonephila clavipes TaxID=2585209 RepID=A0A8X6V0E5_TRICX|nr:hypothetical protein TNCV_3087871 [Trichonephila clavipes]
MNKSQSCRPPHLVEGVYLGGMGDVRWEFSPGCTTSDKKSILVCFPKRKRDGAKHASKLEGQRDDNQK